MHCYERALLPREKGVAYAYYLREQARKTPVNKQGGNAAQVAAFALAAREFTLAAEQAHKEKTTYHRIAAECFVQAGDLARAAEAYYRATAFTLSAKHYRLAGMFDEAVKVVREERVEPSTAESILSVSKVHYLREHKLA